MDTSKFKLHLDNALKLLLDITRQHCYNNFSENFRFIIEPSGREFHDGLNDFETQNLIKLNRLTYKPLTVDQVVALLCHDNKVPLWINTTIYESKQDSTIIHLFCSRRLRNDTELFYAAVKYPPFNTFVPLPPDSLRKEIDGKFDINWKKHFDDRQKSNFFTRIKLLFKNSK